MRRFLKALLLACLAISPACINPVGISTTDSPITKPYGWIGESHGKKADPDYSLLLPEDKVNRIDIIICPVNYSKMESNVITLGMYMAPSLLFIPGTIVLECILFLQI